MTDIEDQLRRYAAATSNAQGPVELGEVVARSGHRSRRLLVGVAAVLVVAVGVGALALRHGHDDRHRIVVAPTTSDASLPARSTAVSTRDCPAASLAVTGKSDEHLHPNWLPAGFVLTQGNESELGSTGGLMYSTPVNGDRPYIEIARYRSALPVEQLVSGTHTPTTVNGHDGIVNVGVPDPRWKAVAWTEAPGTALIVTGYQLSEAIIRRVAESIQYESGSPFTYPTHPTVTVTRDDAIAALGAASEHAHSALTSYGELVAVNSTLSSGDQANVAGIPVTRAVWVAWVPSGLLSDPMPDNGVVVDARSGTIIERLPFVHGGVLAHLTDRSIATCAPPFGVLTRSEASYLRPPRAGTTTIMKLTTQGALDATRTLAGFAQCALHVCDPSAPAWLFVQTAPDQRLNDRGLRSPSSTQPGSWTVSAIDARTGPQSSDLGGFTSSSGPPPADMLAVPDLAPEG
jgi:hypothetical protein